MFFTCFLLLTVISKVLKIVTNTNFLCVCCILISSINASLFPVLTQMPTFTFEGLIVLLIVLSVSAESMNNLLYYWPLFCWNLHEEKIM